jgi:hypothetical protein
LLPRRAWGCFSTPDDLSLWTTTVNSTILAATASPCYTRRPFSSGEPRRDCLKAKRT